jgi:NAD+ diphosphatase
MTFIPHNDSQEGLLFVDNGIVIQQSTNSAFLPIKETTEKLHFTIQSAHLDGNCLIAKGHSQLTDLELSALDYRIYPIRAFLNQAVDELQKKIMRAYHWLNWDTHSRFCGKCGSQLVSAFDKLEKNCVQCDVMVFPKASPAVMVLLHRKNEILLARSPHFQPGVYSAVAGFVEIGESAEEAAAREVQEELGLKIGELRYFASQTWPFPDSFMMAFTSYAPEGELLIDKNEIEDARWFSIRNLPQLPTPVSISRKLIDSVLAQMST